MTKYPRLLAVVFGIAIALAASPSALATEKPPAPQQPVNPSVVIPVTLKPSMNISNYSSSGSYSASGSHSRATGGDASVSNSVTVEADKRRIPVATATAPALTSANGTCMGSSAAGAQGASFGISIGGTWTDDHCDRRYDSIRLQELGMTEAAMLLMCGKESVREAMKLAGTPCPEKEVKTDSVEYTDPIVRRRLGLEPL